MNDQTDQQLLRDYTERQSEAAFAAIVHRYVDLVYSAALRLSCDAHTAKDVTQGVFVALAQNARQLTDRPALAGWLHGTARNLAVKAIRSDVRRRNREQEAAVMNELLSANPDANWEHIAPHLDDALGELSEPDRDAVLLRYFKNHDLRAVGAALGISDDAAQKRVSRAVERLREFFAKRGVTVGASGLAVVISANAVQAAPVGLAVTISTAATLAGTILATTTTTIKTIAMTTLQKTLVTVTVAVLAGTGIYEARQASALRNQVQTLQQQQTPLVQQVEQLTSERDDASNRLASLSTDNGPLNRNTAELIKLRGETMMLRQKTNELGRQLQGSQNTELHDPSTVTPEDLLTQTNFTKESWTFSGFATPEAAIRSFLWAKANGDIKTLLATATPEMREQAIARFKDKSDEENSALLIAEAKDLNGIQILKKMVLADDQVVFQAHFDGRPEKTYSIVTMKKIDGEWKTSNVEERTDDQ